MKVNLHGKDDVGEGTFDKQLTGFKSKKRAHDIIYSSSTLQGNGRTQDLKLVLYYDKIEYPLEEFFRPLRLEPSPILDAAEIQRKKQVLKGKYNAAKNEANNYVKGKLLENVISDVLQLVPGLKIVGRNVNSGIEEIDLQVQNDSSLRIWKEFDRIIFVECKNWSDKVGSNEIRNFEGKLRNFWLHAGIFVAIKGFTGKGGEKGAIGQNRIRFKQEGFKIILIDGNDLNEILRSQDTSEKVNEKWLNLYRQYEP
ncbi:MAG: restriction endonuclease [Thermoproteota archaeon]|nr:restriction endonuclease [Thermoproteota archaeon]